MEIIDRIAAVARADPDRPAHLTVAGALTYADLDAASDALAARLVALLGDDTAPVVVHGHKQSAMLVGFLAAVKSGRPYVPIDDSWPADRTAGVIAESGAKVVIAASMPDAAAVADGVIVIDDPLAPGPGPSTTPVDGDDPFYVIYTSGSTGRPKGVQISADAVTSFVDWAARLAMPSRPGAVQVWLNQAPFSFDLSVMDTYCSLATGGTLCSVDRDLIAAPQRLYAFLRDAGVSVWVSTPSFATLCLADPGFSGELLGGMETFLFCGETLPARTASALHQRFPGARVYNTYGPTEATVAVTSVLIGPDAADPLPVGVPKPGTAILIRTEDGDEAQPGEAGEIVIAGDTVSLGYLHRPELSATVFGTATVDGRPVRSYRTGDLGLLDATGMLHFLGRADHQVKVHGYRIETDDIETNLRRLPQVREAAVVPVTDRTGQVSHLRAFVTLTGAQEGSPLALSTALKRELRALIPDYMIPKVITVVDRIPLTGNGKADRRALLAERP